jgi:hypothetical protein
VAVLVAYLVGITVAWSLCRAAVRERDEWRRAAYKLAGCVRGVDALPVTRVELSGVGGMPGGYALTGQHADRGYALLPIPGTVAVVGDSLPLDRWALKAADALASFDLLVEPEGDR